MRVLHIIPSVTKNDGGPARSSQGIVAALNEAGVETMLATCNVGDTPWVKGVNLFASPDWNDAKNLKGFLEKIIREFRPDVIHLHAIWMWCIHLAASLARKHHIPYLFSPRGMIQPWALKQKWLKKKIAMLTYQGYDLRRATAFHVTSESEFAQVKKLGYVQPIILLPNGVNVPSELPPVNNMQTIKRMLYVGRIHPSKGIRDLVDAWNTVRPKGWICELVYEVHSEFERDYEREIKKCVSDYGLNDAFVFTGALSDDDKWHAYRRADVFVSPSYSENFGITVVESLYAGVPVITTKGTPWSELEERRCGKWVEVGVDGLIPALREMTVLSDDERSEMGMRGRTMVNEKYLWPAIAVKMKNSYEQLIEQKKS